MFQLQELKANPHRNAKGIVIEAGLDKAKGPFATFIVQKGTLKRGDVVVCGEAFGKVYPKFSFLLKPHCAEMTENCEKLTYIGLALFLCLGTSFI